MSRMFKSIDRTWNVFVGCFFDCTYCNARKAALTRLRNIIRYEHGFSPHLVESELKKTFKPGEFIFVAYMGDIAWTVKKDVARILARIREFPQTNFLLQTKHPSSFTWWAQDIPPNVYLGTTIESNRDYKLSKAPEPIWRFQHLLKYPHPHKFLSIEPIMDFDLRAFTVQLENLKPNIIEVGADNYRNNLVEPPPWKLKALLNNLRAICPRVIEKDGLDRIKERE